MKGHYRFWFLFHVVYNLTIHPFHKTKPDDFLFLLKIM